MKLNLWEWSDQSHGGNRSFEGVLRDVGMYDFWLLLLISWNLPWGPDKDESRRNQISQAMEDLFAMTVPEDCPLFIEAAPTMLKELDEAGVFMLQHERSPEWKLWDWLKTKGQFEKTGRRTTMCRFGGTLATASQQRPLWSMHLFQRTWCALELDMLKGKRFTEKLVTKSSAVATGEGGVGNTDPHAADRGRPGAEELLPERTRHQCADVVRLVAQASRRHDHQSCRATDIVAHKTE